MTAWRRLPSLGSDALSYLSSMDNRYYIGAAVIFALIGGAIWWQRGAGKRVLATCAGLEAQRAQLAVSGANTDALARLDIAIATCKEQAEALGESVDSGSSILSGCEIKRRAAASEFNAYKATATEDAIQRNNKRQNILHLGSELIGCYRDAIAAAETSATIDKIRASLNLAINESNDRSQCYFHDMPGCGRYGLNEDHGNDKAGQEGYGTRVPLEMLLVDATAKRDMLRTAERAASRNRMAA